MAVTVGIYGATGQVGGVMRDTLRRRAPGLDIGALRLFASARSAGRELDGIVVEDVATADHRGVDIALDEQPLTVCANLDTDGDGHVEINELIAAVDAALRGCIFNG